MHLQKDHRYLEQTTLLKRNDKVDILNIWKRSLKWYCVWMNCSFGMQTFLYRNIYLLKSYTAHLTLISEPTNLADDILIQKLCWEIGSFYVHWQVPACIVSIMIIDNILIELLYQINALELKSTSLFSERTLLMKAGLSSFSFLSM